MRWIVGSLLLINVVVLVWHLSTREAAVVPTPRVASPAAEGADIQLLSELEAETLQTLKEQKSRVQLSKPEVAQSEEPLCTLVGPFSKVTNAEYFVERLAAVDIKGSVQEVEIPGELGYWVYLAPLDSRKMAFNKLQELQAKGIDSYVIPRGALENGISFGMFSQKDLADRRLAEMKSGGYDAQLDEITRTYKEVWVNLSPGQAKLLPAETWQQMLSEEDGAELRQNYCPPVASN